MTNASRVKVLIAATLAIVLVISGVSALGEISSRGTSRKLLQNGGSSGSLASPAFSVRLRLLVVTSTGDVTTDVPLALARQALESMDIEFDEYVLTSAPTFVPAANQKTGPINNILFGNTTRDGQYQAIICTRFLVLQADFSTYSAVQNYSRTFHARVVYLVSSSNGAEGTIDDVSVPRDSNPATLIVEPTAATLPAFSGLNTSMRVDVIGTFRYPVTIMDPTVAQPVVRFVNSTTGAPLGIAAAIIDHKDGLQSLHFYFEQGSWSFASNVMNHFWTQWATRGIYHGLRRVSLSPTIDDMWLSTRLYSSTPNATAPGFRIGASDLDHLNNFTDTLNNILGYNSSVKFGFAFNALGAGQLVGLQNDALFQRSLQLLPRFFWESHGYTHLNLTQTGTPPHNTTYAETRAEIMQNEVFALSQVFTTNETLRYYERNAWITPAISGLKNPEAIRAIGDSGYSIVMGDNSIPEFRSTVSDYLCARTTAQAANVSALLIVPRYATSVPFDVSLPAEAEVENAALGRPSIYNTAVVNDAIFAARTAIMLRHDSFMFHQANTRVFSYADPITGQLGNWSLITIWGRLVADELRRFILLPVVSYRHSALAGICLDREVRDRCRPDLRLYLDANYNAYGLRASVSTNNSTECRLPITGASLQLFNTTVAGNTTTAAATANPNLSVTLEPYGPDITSWLSLKDNRAYELALSAPFRYEK